jgi:phosphoesterase RecJ-like protein
MPIDWNQFTEIVNAHQSFVLTCHIRPDCDCLGSALGMAYVLETLGKEVRIVTGDPTPPNLSFIDPGDVIQVIGQDVRVDELLDGFDVLMVLDTSSWAQLGPMGDVVRGTKAMKIVLDHHRIGDDIGAIEFKDTTAEATGTLIARAAKHLGVSLTAEASKAVFAAIATDTGWFRFPSTTSETYQVAAALVDSGADPAGIYADLYERDTLGRVRLRGVILNRLTTELEGRLIHTYVLRGDFEETGAIPSDTEDAINYALAVAGTEAAVILIEQPTGGFKISFRSRCKMDSSQVAAQFGGGGHKAAAGAFVEGPFDQVQQDILDAVRKAMA